MEDFAECPVFQARINKLWAGRQHTRHGYGIPAVRAGPFTITDSSDLFQLQSTEGRRAAARWINQTLAAVRPCWNTVRQDQTHYVVDLLYGDLRKGAQGAIDAAFTQDQRQEYLQLHALSPEARARVDENRQFRDATSSQRRSLATPAAKAHAVGRPWIELNDFSVDKVDVASNGPRVQASVNVTLKNVGSIPTSHVSLYFELFDFAQTVDMTPERFRINSCYHAKDFRYHTIERAIAPGETVPMDVSTEQTDVSWPWDSTYGGGADFIVAIGCVSYSLGAADAYGTTEFAYVIGKKVNGKLVRLGQKDGSVTTGGLRWLRLHRDFEE